MSKAILVIGATGKQGGSVLRSLIAHPSFSPKEYSIYGVTRNPASPSAKALAALSPAIKLVSGDFRQPSALFQNLPSKPWGFYFMTSPGKNEAGEGISLVDEAVKAGASHIVFSSVDRGSSNNGMTPSDVPHFITKHSIEEHITKTAENSNGKLSYTFLRPVFFLDNFDMGFFGKITGNIVRDSMNGKAIAVIDTKDIGKFGADAFVNSADSKYRNAAFLLAGDKLTFDQMNDIFKQKTGHGVPTTFSFLSKLLLFLSNDFNKMTKFFANPGFGADPAECNKVHKMTSFSEWLDNSSFVKGKSQ